MTSGRVYLVGAGPGDPELITLKGVRAIRNADAILFDRLVDPRLFDHAKPGALRICCGKAPGRPLMKQEEINRLLVSLAREGKTVVRLKGGDPFVFGRAGEEAAALAEAGIPCEIVPGVSSVTGATAAARVPLTFRGLGGSFAVVTGSRCHGDVPPVRWDLLAAGADTLVVCMGVGRLREIQEELLAHGKDGLTPVALIERGTTDRERVATGTLGEMHRMAETMRLANPALLVIGETVGVRERLLGPAAARSGEPAVPDRIP